MTTRNSKIKTTNDHACTALLLYIHQSHLQKEKKKKKKKNRKRSFSQRIRKRFHVEETFLFPDRTATSECFVIL